MVEREGSPFVHVKGGPSHTKRLEANNALVRISESTMEGDTFGASDEKVILLQNG
jgi:hypothetical protein